MKAVPKYITGFILMLISIIGLNHRANSQSTYKIEDSKDVNIKLMGTSTLHDWEMQATSALGTGEFIFKAGSKSDLSSVKSLSFSLQVEDLKSDNKGLDKNAYKALKSDKYKDINYELVSAIVKAEKSNQYLLKTNGKLTIAGVSREIKMDVLCIVNVNGSINCTGSSKLNMTDFNVEPPSFLLGAMKTGDAITLEFNVTYSKSMGT
ncbi:YceI family protein [uncultured Algoriphagus sp.]|uniref:YceI family protein n=1 Tax=uncultured Algoriphagus sp. TaxID=417365 RepID=UPI0030EB6732